MWEVREGTKVEYSDGSIVMKRITVQTAWGLLKAWVTRSLLCRDGLKFGFYFKVQWEVTNRGLVHMAPLPSFLAFLPKTSVTHWNVLLPEGCPLWNLSTFCFVNLGKLLGSHLRGKKGRKALKSSTRAMMLCYSVYVVTFYFRFLLEEIRVFHLSFMIPP